MVDYKADYVSIDGVRLHYLRCGSGPDKIILLHGATDNGACWKRVSDALAEKYEVFMPDAMGHGLSDRMGKDFKFSDHAHQVAGLARALKIDNPVIAGHSMGGSTATNLAALYPDLPKGIILEDPGWMTLPANPPAQRPENNEFAKRLIEYAEAPMDELVAICRKENPLWTEEDIIPWAESKKQFDQSLFKVLRINEPSWKDMVPKIKCPALLISSENGIVTDEIARQAEEIWTADKPLQYTRIMGAGHNIRREQFDNYYSAVSSFLEGL